MAFVKLAIYATVMGGLLLVGLLVPVVGAVVQASLGFVVTASFLALDHIDWAAARHGLSVRARLGLLRQHPGALLGFGTAVWLMLFAPLVNLLLVPAAVAGGTLLFGDIRRGLGERSKADS
jgi:CysZ protein